jgi:COMPASS component SWD3
MLNNIRRGYVQFSPNSKFILSASLNNKLSLWSLGGHGIKPALLRSYVGHVNEKFCLFAQFLSGKWILAGSEDNDIHLWDLNSAEKITQFSGHSGTSRREQRG